MPAKTHSIILSGVAIGVLASLLSLIPVVNCLACLAYVGAGLLAVWHYTSTYQLTIPGGKGAGMGALSGLIAAAVAQAIAFLLSQLGLAPSMEEAITQALETGMADPDQVDQIRAFVTSPGFLVGALLFSALIAALLGVLGGAIGASVFKKGPVEDHLDTI